MKNLTALFNQLKQAITDLQQQYLSHKREFVKAKFDAALFSENFQPVEFYFDEMKQALSQLHRLTEQDVAQIAFFSEKLLAQYSALSDALSRQIRNQSAVNFQRENSPLTEREKRRQEIEQLPPRERLSKYYDALRALNEMLAQYQDQRQTCTTEQQAKYTQLITQTEQRRQRCLDAIEVLEDYLAFKEAQPPE